MVQSPLLELLPILSIPTNLAMSFCLFICFCETFLMKPRLASNILYRQG